MERTLNKMTYRKSNGDKEVYSYYITITKKEVEQIGIDPNKKVKIKVEGNKIVISK
jgi:hypothetical protein